MFFGKEKMPVFVVGILIGMLLFTPFIVDHGRSGGVFCCFDQDLNTEDNVTFYNFTATGYFIGDGSKLTGVGGGTGTGHWTRVGGVSPIIYTNVSGDAVQVNDTVTANMFVGSGLEHDDLSDNTTDQLSEGVANFWCTLARIKSLCGNDFHNIGGTDDDVPDSGDLGLIDTEAEFESELFAILTPGEGSSGNPFNQDLNTTDSPTFVILTLMNLFGIPFFNNHVMTSNASVNNLSDVNTVKESPSKNDVLMWNGTAFVPVPEGTTFIFSITGFSDGESTTQLIGSGVWQADSTMSYTASYNNGPPTVAIVNMSINGGAYNNVGSMSAPAYTSGTNTEGDINYPASKGQYLRFRLYATDGETPLTDTESSIYFYNYVYWGDTSTGSGFSAANVEALTGSSITSTVTGSKSITAGANEYIAWAYPASYTDRYYGTDYETDGHGTSFRFGGITCAMDQDTTTLSIENSAGYIENYEVYVTTEHSLGSGTFYVGSGDQSINYVYYGKASKDSGFIEGDI